MCQTQAGKHAVQDAGREVMLLMGAPIHKLNVDDLRDRVFGQHLVVGGLRAQASDLQDLHCLGGNMMHCRSIGAAICVLCSAIDVKQIL